MASEMKAIRSRLAAVDNSRRITRAMKMVAASRMRRAQNTMLTIRRYSDELRRLASLISHQVTVDHPLMTPRPEPRREALVVVSGDRGLCGSFNANIARHIRERTDQLVDTGITPVLLFVGRKGAETLRDLPYEQVTIFHHLLQRPSSEAVEPLIDYLAERYLKGDIDRVTVVFNRFRSALTQEIAEEQIFPLTADLFAPQETIPDGERRALLLEPSPAQVADHLIPHFAATELYHDLMESVASELSARMNAMDAATRNAARVADRLRMKYNQARQSAITTELMEIVGGADALAAAAGQA